MLTISVSSKKYKNITVFYWKLFVFAAIKCAIILNGRVFVMETAVFRYNIVTFFFIFASKIDAAR